MTGVQLLKHEILSLKDHAELDEVWVHAQIKQDPSILGLGSLVLKDSERRQAKAGRLDLLLADTGVEPERRFELEVQLGPTDESHIIRTIEYWDLERRVLPKYEHVAVIAAEDITSRFFNVIHLFNRAIPIIALKMVALQVEGGVVLHFVKVLDETAYRPEEKDTSSPADRSYWENASSKESVLALDSLFRIIGSINKELTAHYTQSYVVPELSGRNWGFVWFYPKKRFIRTSVFMPDDAKAKIWVEKLSSQGVEAESYPDSDETWLDLRLTPDFVRKEEAVVAELLRLSCDAFHP